jgi:hypothetical protein
MAPFFYYVWDEANLFNFTGYEEEQFEPSQYIDELIVIELYKFRSIFWKSIDANCNVFIRWLAKSR